MNGSGDTLAFALLVGIPLAGMSWLAAKAILLVAGRRSAWIVGGIVILAWPVYYVARTLDDESFADGLPVLLFTTPAMMLGWIGALARLSRR